VEKNAQNIDANDTNLMQDISVMGMIRRIGNIETLPNLWITAPAAICYGIPLLRFKQYRSALFRISYLCLAMIGVVIFSSSAESSTFVIAVTAIGAWYVAQQPPYTRSSNLLLALVILLTSLSATDLFPPYLRDNWIRPYSLKALPCFIMWLVILWQLLFRDFSATEISGHGPHTGRSGSRTDAPAIQATQQ
jgi:hypothetical protein